MKRILFIPILFALTLISCSHEDIWAELREHEERIAELEELCKVMNTNITSLQTIVSALEQKDYVTAVTSIKVDGVIIGYTISFSQSGDVNIYHGHDGNDGEDGTDGSDGYTPQIGVKSDEDGIYYWTLDGEWLLDEDGNRIKASSTDGVDGTDGSDGADGEDGKDGADGKDGEDGITPRMKIENDLWYVSYDGGKTWILAGRAVGRDGTNVFSDIKVAEDEVTLTLADGETVITLPRKQKIFDIAFEDGATVRCGAGETVSIPYSLSYGSENAVIRLFPDHSLDVSIEQTDALSGVVTITAPDPFMEDVELTMLVSDGAEKTIMRTLTMTLEYDDSYIIRYESNTGQKVDASIPAMLSNTYSDGKGEIVLGTRVKTVTGFAGHIDLKSIIIPATASVIGNAAFKDCTGLYEIDIPDSIQSIEDYAFAGCDRLISVNFGSGLSRIGGNAFEGCTGFTEFEIPDRVTSLGGYAFKDCSQDLKLMISYDLLMKSPQNKSGNIILKGNPSAVANSAFQNCVDLRSIVIPESVVEIGSLAFSGCTSLSQITFGQDVNSIGQGVFAGTLISSFTIPSKVMNLPARTFEGCRKLLNVDLGESITSIGDSAFENCSSLESVIIPNSVTSIGSRAFIGTWMDEVTIGKGVKSIGSYAFAGLFFKDIILPDSLEELGDAAFGSCAHLEYITLGNSLKSVPSRAFYYCGSLKALTIPTTVEAIASEAFTGCKNLSALNCEPVIPPSMASEIPELTSIYVPHASLEAYQSAEGWSQYASRIYQKE